MSDAVFPSYPVTEEEPLSSIVARLKNNWRNHSETIGEALMRLIACLDSGSDLNLSGIDRDLIVYAMAHTRSVAQRRPMPPEPYWLPFKVVSGCIRDAKDNYVAELSSPFGGHIRDEMAQFLVEAANACSLPSTEGK